MEKREIRKAFGAIKGWYKEAGPKPPKPSAEELNLTGAEYANLYADDEEPSEDPIPIHVKVSTLPTIRQTKMRSVKR